MMIDAARLFGVARVRGAIKRGFAADIVAVPENPLNNIQAARKAPFVMKDGSVLEAECGAAPAGQQDARTTISFRETRSNPHNPYPY